MTIMRWFVQDKDCHWFAKQLVKNSCQINYVSSILRKKIMSPLLFLFPPWMKFCVSRLTVIENISVGAVSSSYEYIHALEVKKFDNWLTLRTINSKWYQINKKYNFYISLKSFFLTFFFNKFVANVHSATKWTVPVITISFRTVMILTLRTTTVPISIALVHQIWSLLTIMLTILTTQYLSINKRIITIGSWTQSTQVPS